MYDLMARGALQSLSLPCSADTHSGFRMLLHEVYNSLATVTCKYNIIVLGCTHLCIGSIQVGIL